MPAQPLAVCTWVFGHHDHARIAADVARLGLSGVEVLTDIDRQPAEQIASIYGERGLEIVSMTPDNVDLAHVNPAHRTDAIHYYERLIAYAAVLGCPTVTCHETRPSASIWRPTWPMPDRTMVSPPTSPSTSRPPFAGT